MQISSPTAMPYVERTSPTVGAGRTSADAPTPTETLAASLTTSDRSFLLNALGMSVSSQGDTVTFHGLEGLSGEDGKAASQLAMQLMADRQRGAIEGDITPDYLHSLLIRAGDDSGQAFQDVITKALAYLAEGGPITRVDTRV